MEKKMDKMTLELNSPITEEQWDLLEDVDLDNTERIYFHTKHGKEVEFVKVCEAEKSGGCHGNLKKKKME